MHTAEYSAAWRRQCPADVPCGCAANHVSVRIRIAGRVQVHASLCATLTMSVRAHADQAVSREPCRMPACVPPCSVSALQTHAMTSRLSEQRMHCRAVHSELTWEFPLM
eukprot:1353140-Prymnesium_polylepis.1